MSARDELAEVIDRADSEWDKVVAPSVEWAQDMADAILAAGYTKPRTINTVEELDGLPVGSIILDSEPDACRKNEDGLWISLNDPEMAGLTRSGNESVARDSGGADAWFIAHARTDIPALLALVYEQQAKLNAVRGLADRAESHGNDTLYVHEVQEALESSDD